MWARVLLVAALVLGAAGCDRKVEPFVPGEKSEQPDLSRIFPEGAETTAKIPTEPPPAPARGAPPVASSAAPPIRGSIQLSPQLRDRVPEGAVLFLVARSAAGGPPLAAKRIEVLDFPLDYSLGPDDRMVAARPFVGPLRITVRVDADGNASTRNPGDLVGSAPGLYEPGARGVAVLIDEIL